MANNLFISYDLHKDKVGKGAKENSKDYEKVGDAVKSLGAYTKLQYSMFFVNTNHSCKDAADIIISAIDKNDSLLVIDVTNSEIVALNIHKDLPQFPPGASVDLMMKHLRPSFKLIT